MGAPWGPNPPRLLLAILSGVLLALSFPKFGHPLFAWVCLVPLLAALDGVSPARAARLAYLAGLVSSAGLLYWVAIVVMEFGGLSLLAGVLVTGLLCLAFSLFTAGFGLTVGILGRRWGSAALLAAPFPWVAFELLRTHTFFSFPWCLLGYSQYAYPTFLQIAPYTAVYGVSFALAASSSLLAFALREPRSRRGATLSLVLLIGGLFVFGRLSIAASPRSEGTIRVGLVQGNIPEEQKWDTQRGVLNLKRHEALTRTGAAAGARLVVWPESALPFYFDGSPVVAEEIRDLTRTLRIHLLFGNDDALRDRFGEERYYVGAKMVDPAGALSLRYHKIHLVPFGEYVPLRGLLAGMGVGKLVQQVSDFTPGNEFSVGTIDGHRVAALICYEGIFPDLVRHFSRDGAELLVNITNDAWYGKTSAPYQHFSTVVLRAVENRRFVVRAANTGITAVVDPVGRVLERTGLFETSVLVRDAGFVSERTFYALHGDVFAWGCFALTLLLALAAGRRTKHG